MSQKETKSKYGLAGNGIKKNMEEHKLTFPQPDIVQRWGLCDATCGGILSEPEPDIKSTCSKREISIHI